ncbi:MAG TPA: DUF2298 domain-containing protein [Anaerolineae bacterium]|nr:DUF2298 domain-containing protein [Anaerolineae bacterium]HQI83771.1 DUF2298 domain-containing protein [Anaerolineae bacterium]
MGIETKHTVKSNLTSRLLVILLFLVIFFAAVWVRSYNIDWDEGTHLHPDERYLTMVVSALELPANPALYWNTADSPLNPTNKGYAGYVYGTFPLLLTRVVAGWVDQACAHPPTATGVFLRWLLLNASGACYPGHYLGYGGIHFVGRALSALMDLATLVALALLTRALYGNKTALLAAALYAFAVLPIQHAHFFVVDSFATVFVAWTLCFAVYAVQYRKPWLLPLAGLTTGLAVASKISVWPLAGVVGLAAVLHREPAEVEGNPSRYRFALMPAPVIAVIISGILAALAFRSAQPYAFTGPGFFDVRINPSWMSTMKDAQELANGLRDVPFGHQWTDRTPIIFPGRNMIYWGMGLPLGIAAWIGWGVMGWRIVRRRRWQHLLIWAWGTLLFLYQGTQWVKSMRYLLPVYPVFVIYAAWGLIHGATQGHAWPVLGQTWRKAVKGALQILPGVVLAGTIVWAAAFLHIYSRSLTRVEASRWMYNNIPAVATLHADNGLKMQASVPPDTLLSKYSPVSLTPFTPETSMTVTRLTLNKVNSVSAGGRRRLNMALLNDPNGTTRLAEATVEVDLPTTGLQTIEADLPSPVLLEAGKAVYLEITLLDGEIIKLQTSVIANEHWDDALPQRVDGKDAFGNWYRSLSSNPPNGQMDNYNNDTPEKRQSLFDWLDEADYIVLSSNRLYASIPRLAMRYPFTTAYYEALFNGSLGFELLAEFVSYPALGPCQFPDQEIPFALMEPRYTNARPCQIMFPPAEEAFSVYDHPTVLIFAKTPAYSRARAAALLPLSLLDDVRWMTPLEATRNKSNGKLTLVMTPRMRAEQEAGGTWSKLFNRNALHNRSQILAVTVWWMMLAALGILAFPWLYYAFPALRDRGYGLSRIVGLLAWSYVAWLLSSLKLLPHTRLLLWGVFFFWAIVSGLFVYRRWDEFRTFLQEHWRDMLYVEIIFAALYLFWVYVRSLNPDLWHPVAGGEKPMDFSYLNAIIKSTWFPPYDPWFAGGTMNYYYFGFVMIGSLIKAVGIVPSVAYNLAVPALYALTGVGAYVVASNLAGGDAKRGLRAGLLGTFLVLVLGNLGELRLLFTGLEDIGNIQFDSLIPGYPAVVSAIVGLWKVVMQGQSLAFRPEWWYWNASRVIPFAEGEVGAINEFPAFTFLYADLHAHMMALPLTQVALAIALQWGIGAEPAPGSVKRSWLAHLRRCIPHPLPTFVLAGLIAGALKATNTWDWPTYLALMSVGLLFTFFNPRTSDSKSELAEDPKPIFPYYKVLTPILFVLLGEVLFRPYITNYASAYTSFGLWKGSRTPLGIYLIMHGHFLFPIVVLAVVRGLALFRRIRDGKDASVWLALGMALLGMAILAVVLLVVGVAVTWIVIPLGTLAALLILDPQCAPRARLLWMWVGTALALSLLVEVVVLEGDIGRMNTVFKFYLQVWMLLGLSAAVAAERIIHYALSSYRAEQESSLNKIPYFVSDMVSGILAVLLAAAAMYTILAIPAKARDRWSPQAPHTLDGMAFLPYATQIERGADIPLAADDRVIRWLQENVAGSPTIIEGQGEREYLWGGRITVYTGLPSVAAWRWHSVQQRMTMPGGTVEARQADIRYFYNTMDAGQALKILTRYDVRYVILGPYERAYMMPEGLAKFKEMVERGWLETVYEDELSTVYYVVSQ